MDSRDDATDAANLTHPPRGGWEFARLDSRDARYPAMSDDRWFVSDGQSQTRPLTIEGLPEELARQGSELARVVWREGMNDGVPLDLANVAALEQGSTEDRNTHLTRLNWVRVVIAAAPVALLALLTTLKVNNA